MTFLSYRNLVIVVLPNPQKGINGDEVESRVLPKSHGTGKTFPGRNCLKTIAGIERWLSEFSDELAERLEADLEQNKRIAQTLTLHASASKANESQSQKKFPSKSCPLRYGSTLLRPQVLVLVRTLLRPLFQLLHLHFTDCIKFAVGSESSLRKHLQEPQTECSKDGTKMNIVMQTHQDDESRMFEDKALIYNLKLSSLYFLTPQQLDQPFGVLYVDWTSSEAQTSFSREYQSNPDVMEFRIDTINKKLGSSEGLDGLDELVSGAKKSHGRGWLIGRHDPKCLKTSTSAPAPTDSYVQELTKKIRQEVAVEVEAKVNQKVCAEVDGKINRKVQDNLTLALKKLAEANPTLNVDIGEICATISSDTVGDGTPMTNGPSS
ncbi:hypothetical protein POM88_002095 [Heracleum sosnowskyi]|uniref:DNA polymerase Y-family little finger domain-containing protein n=1 Tax=Heracleum sosnowskyi TaxID=360622 RepID=A0AAD8JHW0_9APIA|nr:hypothetical protein POM88_002095 [Heracleum sosnowskyi]